MSAHFIVTQNLSTTNGFTSNVCRTITYVGTAAAVVVVVAALAFSNSDTSARPVQHRTRRNRGGTRNQRHSPSLRSNRQTSSDFHRFIGHVVDVFNKQRSMKKQYQFAVLIISPHQHSTEFLTRESMTGTSDVAYTNNRYSSFPSNNDSICNYITARLNRQDHAEALLMRRFEALMRAYETYTSLPKCRSILLYTWLFPCTWCKRKISRTLKSYTGSHQVILVYTKSLTDDDTTDDLESAGIIVKHETYDKYLPPAQ